MRIVVHVAEPELRGIPFEKFASVLDNLLDEEFHPDDRNILPGTVTTVSVERQCDSDDTNEILAMVKDMTDPEVFDAYFE
jgi:hypothetical protein